MIERWMNKEGAPVFFRVQGNGDQQEIRDLGLAFMYKLPYDNSPYDLLSDNHKSVKPDLAECIFGYSNKTSSLKGRVQFSHAFTENKTTIGKITLSLSSPKASYYPMYIKQEGNNGITLNYNTYNNGKLAGWKRYQIRKNYWIKNTGNPLLDTSILPIDRGALFECKIRFHNLKAAELGALLSALTFHNSSDCYHQIGQGKPFGFGKVKIEAKLMNDLSEQETFFMSKFEETISEYFPNWIQDQSLQELITLSHEQVDADDVLYQYMNMSNNRPDNEFLTAKSLNLFLQKYSELINRRIPINSLCSEVNNQKYIEALEKEEMEFQKEKMKVFKELEEIKTKERLEQIEKLNRRIENGLAFLNELNLSTGEYKVNDFNGAKNRIDQWLKKSNNLLIPEEHFDTLTEGLKRIFNSTKEKDKKDWLDFQNSRIWKIISEWVSEEKAKEIFSNVVNQ